MRPLGRAAVRFSLTPNKATEEALRKAIRVIYAQIAHSSVPVLISHENMIGAMPGNGGTMTLYPYVEAILRIYSEEWDGKPPQIMLMTREMADWKRSVHNQAVKSDGYTGTWDEFSKELQSIQDWHALEQRLRTAFGSRFASFSLESDNRQPGLQLLQHLGVPSRVLRKLPAINATTKASLGAGGLEFLRLVNAAHIGSEARSKVGRIVIENPQLFAQEVTE